MLSLPDRDAWDKLVIYIFSIEREAESNLGLRLEIYVRWIQWQTHFNMFCEFGIFGIGPKAIDHWSWIFVVG